MRRIRTIPVLLLSQNGMVKTKSFSKPRYLGDPINAVKIFNEKMVDELILLDIEATTKNKIEFDWIKDIVSEAFMPVAYGGGISTLDDCARLLASGVEKVVINTAAVEQPNLISQAAQRFGSQAVVVSIDAKRNMWKQWKAYIRGGRKQSRFSPVNLAVACEHLGAGEIMLTSMEREGAFDGFDVELLKSVTDTVGIPVIAHGGAGKIADFVPVVTAGGASAIAAGSMFVFAAKGEGMLISYPSQNELKTQFWDFVAG
jgi:imidazole glycerol-phosphate synthase subunit HisF